MNEANTEYENRLPDFDAVAILQQRLAQKKTVTSSEQSPDSNSAFDPYKTMLKRKTESNGSSVADSPVQSWPERDIKSLEEFCKQHGIIGFNCGRMSPLAALAMLKRKLGVIDEFPTSEGYTPNYPYTEKVRKRILLSG